MKVKIYHNPRCRKSREALELLQKENIEPEIVLYLKVIPTKKEIKGLLEKLGINAESLVRKNEPFYKEKFKGKKLTEAQWITAMVSYPKLIERPIVVKGNKAIVGRPPTDILSLF